MNEPNQKFSIFLIECRTGCTCCSDENHYRGPYKTKEGAERRIAYYFDPKSKFWPLASQYAKRGHYAVQEVQVEQLPDGRVILNDRHVASGLQFIVVYDDGTVDDDLIFDGID